MNLTPEQLRQNAAAMLAFADGKPVQYRNIGCQLWSNFDAPGYRWDCNSFEFRPKPWSLPAPPAGRKWHREDFTEEMLPVIDGKPTRPLLMGEVIQAEDRCQYPPDLENGGWHEPGGGAEKTGCSPYHFHFRTTRPLPKEPTVRWWRQEDVPCGIYLRNAGKQDAHYLPANICRDSIEITFKGKNYFLTWETLAKFYEHSTDRKTWLPCTVTEEGE